MYVTKKTNKCIQIKQLIPYRLYIPKLVFIYFCVLPFKVKSSNIEKLSYVIYLKIVEKKQT